MRSPDSCDVLANRSDDVGDNPGEPPEQLVEAHRRIDEILGLLAQELDEAVRIEVEQVAEENVRRTDICTSLSRMTEHP